MTKRITLSELRNVIDMINREVMDEQGNGEIANATVLSRVKKAHSQAVEFLTPQLLDIALTRLLNEVSNRKRGRNIAPGEIDLFGDYCGLKRQVSIGVGRKKDIANLSLQEAELWLKAHSAKARSTKHEEFKRLLDDCRPFITSDEDTLETAMRRKKGVESPSINLLTADS